MVVNSVLSTHTVMVVNSVFSTHTVMVVKSVMSSDTVMVVKSDVFCCCFFLGGGVTARQDYFTHFEPTQSQGAAKTGEKPLEHLQAELCLTHM